MRKMGRLVSLMGDLLPVYAILGKQKARCSLVLANFLRFQEGDPPIVATMVRYRRQKIQILGVWFRWPRH